MDQGLKEEILEQLSGRIEPVKTSKSYNIGLLFVAITMVILPLLYLALISFTSWAVYMYATDWGKENTSHVTRASLFMYLTPIITGSVLVFFMIKPLFARRPKHSGSLEINPNEEPFLFEYIYALCNLVGSPFPKKVAIDCEVNASAGFSNGIFSLLRKGDLTLTIGLPLVEGMPLRSLTGVLAHEFGHFSQGFGMRMTLIIRTVNAWFARVVYERDSWDEGLAKAGEFDIRLTIVVLIAQLFIFLTRKILWLLMMLGHVISCNMLREMEFDADRYEARVAGSSSFKETAEKLLMLNVASQKTYNELQVAWQENKLADQLPKMISENVDEIPEELKKDILKDQLEKKTEFFDTHPCDTERNASAEKENTPGVFSLEIESKVLFKNYENLSKKASLDMYRSLLGKIVKESNLHPVEQLKAERLQKEEGFKALDRFFQGTLHPNIPVTSKSLNHLTAEDLTADFFTREREALCSKAPSIRKKIKNSKNLQDPMLKEHRMEYCKRLNAALSCTEYLIDKLGEEVHLQKVKLHEAMTLMADHVAPMMKLKEKLESLERGLKRLEQNSENENEINQVRTLIKSTYLALQKIKKDLPKEPYPYDFDGSISKFLLPRTPSSEENLEHIFQYSVEFIDKFYSLYYRLLADLTLIAEKVEGCFGLEPLNELDEKEKSPEISEDLTEPVLQSS